MKPEAVVVDVQHGKGKQSGAQKGGGGKQDTVSGSEPLIGAQQAQLDKRAQADNQKQSKTEANYQGGGYGQAIAGKTIGPHQSAHNPVFRLSAGWRCCGLFTVVIAFPRPVRSRRCMIRRRPHASRARIGEANGLRIECVLRSCQPDLDRVTCLAQCLDVKFFSGASGCQTAEIRNLYSRLRLLENDRTVSSGYEYGLKAVAQRNRERRNEFGYVASCVHGLCALGISRT